MAAHFHESQRFVLVRDEDESGVSGTGVVADGVQFRTGWIALCWRNAGTGGRIETAINTGMGIYPDLEAVRTVHGHGGKTRIEWVDRDAPNI